MKHCGDLGARRDRRREDHGTTRLVAHVVRGPNSLATAETLKRSLSQQLPHYMVPSLFVFAEALPLTASGKVNRKALPVPQAEAPPEGTLADDVERRLAALWQEVLGRPVGAHDDFFELGGHSLLAVRLLGRVEAELGVRLRLTVVFEAGTVADMAEIVRKQRVT